MIKLYASGDGALHFASLDDAGVSAYPPVTPEQALDYLAGHPDADHLRQDGWRIVNLQGRPVAVAPIKRLDPTTLLVKDQVYSYELDPEGVRDGGTWIVDSALTIKFNYNGWRDCEVKDWSIRAQVRHFLKYERELTAQAWVEIPVVFAGEGI